MANGKLTYINVGPGGTFRESGRLQTTPQDIDAIFSHLKNSGARKLAIHFHGGLIAEKEGFKISEKMQSVYVDAGSHPVTFIWETGLVETIKNNLETIYATRLFQKILIWVVKKSAKKLGLEVDARGAGEEMTTAEVRIELAQTFPFENLDSSVGARGGSAPVSDATLELDRVEIEAELQEEMDGDEEFKAILETRATGTDLASIEKLEPSVSDSQKGIDLIAKAAIAVAKIAIRVIRRWITKHHHGFYPTVVEEILRELYLADAGAWVWQGMKTAAEQMWSANLGLLGNDRHVGRYFLEGLVQLQQSTNLKVDVIGHSAGSIAICYLLRAIAQSNLSVTIRNVLLLAPAARSDLFLAEIVQHPERFASLRIFTMEDTFESQDRLAGAIYTRSLLYLISGILEDGDDVPIVGMHRYLSGKAPYDSAIFAKILAYLMHGQKPLVVLAKSEKWAPDAVAGFITNAGRHGDFDDDEGTRSSLTAIIGQ